MGAELVVKTYEGRLTFDEMKAKFSEAQERDRYDNGHSYSGGIGMLAGVKDRRGGQPFGTVQQAEDWIADNQDKWGPALAVKALHQMTNGTAVEVWVVGGWCAS